MLNNNEETEISYVSIAVSNTKDFEHLYNYSIRSITKLKSLNTTFSYLNREVDDQITVHIITVDKCYQESLSEIISCRMITSKGKITNNM